jgi:hypothetical protein
VYEDNGYGNMESSFEVVMMVPLYGILAKKSSDGCRKFRNEPLRLQKSIQRVKTAIGDTPMAVL